LNIADKRGSLWRRWDPHLHAPGTILADNFGKDAWPNYLYAIEQSEPRITALGVTDYYSIRGYQDVLAHKRAGRLPDVDLIFANVEMRFGIGTGHNHPVNFHLLISPEDPEHVEQTLRFMRRLKFEAHGDSFACDRDDLILLGKAHLKDNAAPDHTALAAGTNQFKVDLAQLKEEWGKSDWAQANILIAVAAAEGDGTSGLQNDSSLATVRKEIEKFAAIIFASSSKQRDFWLGLGVATPEDIRTSWNGPKPCLHGSDAHALNRVGKPAEDRFTWVKGDLTFEALRQACLEPSGRAFVGNAPPRGALPSEVISKLKVSYAPWFTEGEISLNPGLVAVIGARGSGKTALAELLAAGAYAATPHPADKENKSFLHRASKYLGTASATLEWESGAPTHNELGSVEIEGLLDSPRVRYLSQQFVDALCSAEGVTDELLAEIERVIFQAHPEEDRMSAANFQELLQLRAEGARAARSREESAILQASSDLAAERQRQASAPALKKQRDDAAALIAKDKADRQTLLGKGTGSTSVSDRLTEVAAIAAIRRSQIQQTQRKWQSLTVLRDEVKAMKGQVLPGRLREMKQAYALAGLSSGDWATFELKFSGDVDSVLTSAIAAVDRDVASLRGASVPKIAANAPIPTGSLLESGVELQRQTLNRLDAEISRLTGLVGIASENSKAYARLSEKITTSETNLEKLDRQLVLANAASARIAEIIEERKDGYRRIFEAIIGEEDELSSLYGPLKARITGEKGALGRLTFNVRRTADATEWARAGELLLDLRKTGPFRGKGALLSAAQAELVLAWETGSAQDAADAMAAFRAKHDAELMEHAPVERSNQTAYREWANKISAWLYNTAHIKIRYSIQYDDVEIEQLSPGTRGIVLLLLYLSIDRDDDRPLIIDQPEENLDPKSVFDELVNRFRDAKTRRQIIVVTHNANLVVNADADQIIVAKAGHHRKGGLPDISYVSGGLENSEIRKQVCEILEGGEPAFVERAKRLRIKI
jgi:energy-coupling factor transporter ATP-binding protein EcfA2